jgi:hypothetical protein
MSSDNNNNKPQQQQREPNYDLQGNVVRGRAGNLMGVDRGPLRGGLFEAIDPRAFDSSPQGASSSIQGWVLMISNLSPTTTEADLRLFLSDVDPTENMFGDGTGNSNNNNNNDGNNNNANNNNADPTSQAAKFISELKMNMSAKNVNCLGHAFVKTPKLEWAYRIQQLNGREFVDDLPVSVDFAFRVPPPPTASDENNNNNKPLHLASGKQRFRGDEEDHSTVGPEAPSRNFDSEKE